MAANTTNQSTGPSAGQTTGQSSSTNSSSSSSGRPDSIKDALRILDEALGQGKGANLKDLVTSEYQNLSSAIGSVSPRMAESLRSYGSQAYSRVSDVASNFSSEGFERGKQIYSNVDSSVRSNPWPVIGGVAVGTFALGFIFGRSGAKSSSVSY